MVGAYTPERDLRTGRGKGQCLCIEGLPLLCARRKWWRHLVLGCDHVLVGERKVYKIVDRQKRHGRRQNQLITGRAGSSHMEPAVGWLPSLEGRGRQWVGSGGLGHYWPLASSEEQEWRR